MLTEEEAKTKWCSHQRMSLAGDGHMYSNKPIVGDNDTGSMQADKAFCIGSACMAWRWEMAQQYDANQPAHEWVSVQTERGYCGLAGRPA